MDVITYALLKKQMINKETSIIINGESVTGDIKDYVLTPLDALTNAQIEELLQED